jgi:hypothetical protein
MYLRAIESMFSINSTNLTKAAEPADSVKVTKWVIAVATKVTSDIKTSLPLAIVKADVLVCVPPELVPISNVSVAPLV